MGVLADQAVVDICITKSICPISVSLGRNAARDGRAFVLSLVSGFSAWNLSMGAGDEIGSCVNRLMYGLHSSSYKMRALIQPGVCQQNIC